VNDVVTAPQNEGQAQAYKEAAEQLAVGIAMGLVPFLGQAIDAYDTIESSIHLYNAKQPAEKEDAQFDMLLAIVGWIPGPGDGVKKSLRIVNKDPQRYAPVLFDLLRFVLKTCGIETSPEELLAQIFNAENLKAKLAEIEKGVKDSEAFKALPQWLQDAVMGTLRNCSLAMPVMVGIVEKRLAKWKRMQHNSSAHETSQGRTNRPPPKAQDSTVASQGHARPAGGQADSTISAQLKRQALADLTNEMAGISGEHIADYICAYTFGWGGDWKGHDDGAGGKWMKGQPGKTKTGKLSKGGSPKASHILYKLSDGANGTGIDAVWRAEGRNEGKPYAIVEAKATRNEDAPKFLRKPGNIRKPSINSTLGDNAVTDPSELLEPLEDAPTSTKGGGGKAGGRSGRSSATQKPKAAASSTKATGKPAKSILVQMSREWIRTSMGKAVGELLARDVLLSYSRHLFFSPAYHLSGSPAAHMKARLTSAQPSEHAAHDAFHYDESDVKKAVNKRKAVLSKKYGNLSSLKAEK
jgi:hypothetical protein